jgi:ethanolaminephosphotransferase
VEGILTLCVVYAATAYFGGGSFWAKPMLETIGIGQMSLVPDFIYKLAFNDWYLVYGGIMVVLNTVQRWVSNKTTTRAISGRWLCQQSAINVQNARRARGQRARKALLGLVPFFVQWFLITIYLALNPLVLHQHLVPFVFFVGLINAYSVGQMIVAHLTKSRFPYFNVLTIPLFLGVMDSMGPVCQKYLGVGWPSALGHDVYQVSFMFMCLGTAMGVYGSFVIDVIYTICDYLDIWCLKIKHPYVPEENGAVAGKKAQ